MGALSIILEIRKESKITKLTNKAVNFFMNHLSYQTYTRAKLPLDVYIQFASQLNCAKTEHDLSYAAPSTAITTANCRDILYYF